MQTISYKCWNEWKGCRLWTHFCNYLNYGFLLLYYSFLLQEDGKREMTKEMSIQVSQMVSQYLALDEAHSIKRKEGL